MLTSVTGYQLFQVEIKKGYSVADWREDIKRCLLNAGIKDKPTTFLFNDAQIVNETMLEDINNILNAGDVPNLYGPEEMDQIMTVCRAGKYRALTIHIQRPSCVLICFCYLFTDL